MNASQKQTPEAEPSGPLFESVSWFSLATRKKKWLVDGLLLRRGSSLLAGKPKAGKSMCAKNVAAAVVKGRSVLGRNVDTGNKPGRVIYLQLEGKDDVASTAEQLRALGVTQEESSRLRIYERTLQRGVLEERVQWLVELLKTFPADIVVVDTLRLFTGKAVKDTNSYDDTVEAMDRIEPILRHAGWQGHLMVVHHGRKDDDKKNQMLDSVLGSSGLAASFNTIMLVSHPDDDEPLRLLASKQNETDKAFGDLKRTELLIDENTFELTLGRTYKDICADQKKNIQESLSLRIRNYLLNHPGSTLAEVKVGVGAREQTVRQALNEFWEKKTVTRDGKGTRTSPFTFSVSQEYVESMKMVGQPIEAKS